MKHLADTLATEAGAIPPKLAAPRPAAGVGVLLAPVVLFVAAAALFLFNPAEHAFYPRCFFQQSTGLHCPGCGGLRAVHQLSHGHLLAALHHNALAVLALPFAAALLGREWLRRRRGAEHGSHVASQNEDASAIHSLELPDEPTPVKRAEARAPAACASSRCGRAGVRWVWLCLAVMFLFAILRNLPAFAFLAP